VLGPIELDSIEFSALHFGSAIIMVLGHKNCGAVNAVLKGTTQDIESIATLIYPAVKQCKGKSGDALANAVKMNVMQSVHQLKDSKVISQLMEKGKLKVVGGYYDLDTGLVEVLE
jgi:carbonic anhydrase